MHFKKFNENQTDYISKSIQSNNANEFSTNILS